MFTAVSSVAIERRATVLREEYVGYLSTVSAYLQLPARDRATVLARIAAALPREVEVNSDITLHLARRTTLSPDS